MATKRGRNSHWNTINAHKIAIFANVPEWRLIGGGSMPDFPFSLLLGACRLLSVQVESNHTDINCCIPGT